MSARAKDKGKEKDAPKGKKYEASEDTSKSVNSKEIVKKKASFNDEEAAVPKPGNGSNGGKKRTPQEEPDIVDDDSVSEDEEPYVPNRLERRLSVRPFGAFFSIDHCISICV